MKKIYLLVVLASLCIQSQAGGPWASGKNKGYMQLGYTSIAYQNVFNATGGIDSFASQVNDRTLQFYGEYGLNERLDVRVILPFAMQNMDSKGDSNISNGSLSALGNITIGLNYALKTKNSMKLSLGLNVTTPANTLDPATGLNSGYNAWIIAPQLFVGQGFDKLYYFGNVGFNYMSNDYSSFISSQWEVGYTFKKRIVTAFALNLRAPLDNGSIASVPASKFTGLYVNNQSFYSFGFKLAYFIIPDKFGVNASAYAALGGKNVAAGPPFNGGIFYKL